MKHVVPLKFHNSTKQEQINQQSRLLCLIKRHLMSFICYTKINDVVNQNLDFFCFL